MKQILLTLSVVISSLTVGNASAQNTVRIDAANTHQRITGFGGFVCSPQFGYNHMSAADIKKVWGASSTVGCNIMRLYIPIGRNYWYQSLETAKTAKQLGLIVFASPWGQPAEWKTNNSSNAVNDAGERGSLKKENWADYAQYLDDYVQYLRNNGVELDAISIQNEPDWPCSYAGCLWSEADMAEFVKTYGSQISCRIITPETLAVSDSYANALNSTEVLDGFDIYGGHQYGGIGSAYKKLAAKGKEIWMTEYLINWNENQSSNRNFDFSKDFFDFFRAINVCMLGDFNAWIHYAAKRYYGMLGDGQMGTINGTVTKRGYVMAHFAKYVTGMTRIDADFGSTGLEGSAYISQSGDTVVAVIANAEAGAMDVTLDLPFYTVTGRQYTTTSTRNMLYNALTAEAETFRPVVTLSAKCVSTILFTRSRDRQPSDMKGTVTHFDRIDDMKATKSTFGTAFKMSGKTKTLDHSNALISANTTSTNGYVALDDRYSRLVLNVKKVTSTLNYSSAKTTLTYVNAAGSVVSHDYGDLDLSRRENFSMVFDLSPQTLADGCKGLISLTNNNWSSTLSLTFGDVILDHGVAAPYAATLSGTYTDDDSNVMEYTADAQCVNLDMTACSACPSAYPWLQGTNRVVWLPEDATADGANVVSNDVCPDLRLYSDGGAFRPVRPFQAEQATFTTPIDGCRLLMLPFSAEVPQGVTAYSIGSDMTLTVMDVIPAHTPVLVAADGGDQPDAIVFSGTGSVSFAKSPLGNMLRGTYTPVQLFSGDYVLARQDETWGFQRVATTAVLSPFDAYASIKSQAAFIPLELQTVGIALTEADSRKGDDGVYDLQGRTVRDKVLKPGVYVSKGKKIMIR